MRLSDFWWLSPSEKAKYKYVELTHREIGRNEEQTEERQIVDIASISHWRERFQNTNVYRSLKVMSAPSRVQELLGPFVVDIDNESEDLEDALNVAKKAAQYLGASFGIDASELRVFFTGRKGFNLEALPKALGIVGPVGDQIRQSADQLDDLITILRAGNTWGTVNQVTEGGTLIDRIYGSRRFGYGLKHPDIRLHDSINRWISSDGKSMARKKIGLSIDELRTLTVAEILTRAETESLAE